MLVWRDRESARSVVWVSVKPTEVGAPPEYQGLANAPEWLAVGKETLQFSDHPFTVVSE